MTSGEQNEVCSPFPLLLNRGAGNHEVVIIANVIVFPSPAHVQPLKVAQMKVNQIVSPRKCTWLPAGSKWHAE